MEHNMLHGVIYKNNHKWTAYIDRHGKGYNLGVFETQELAFKAYKKEFREKYFGEGARYQTAS